MASGTILKSVAVFKEKRRSNSMQHVMLQSGRYGKKTLRNELRRNFVSGSCLFVEACRCKGNTFLSIYSGTSLASFINTSDFRGAMKHHPRVQTARCDRSTTQH